MSSDPTKLTNVAEVAGILCEFFEIIIHNILFVRKLYPEGIFVKRKKYGVVVNKSVHPFINEYISQALKAVFFHLKVKQLRKLLVCFISNEKIVERYVFDILNFEENLEGDPYAVKLEQHLRSLYLKLITSTSYLHALPKDSNFAIQLHISEYSNVEFNDDPLNEEFPWIQINANNQQLNCANVVPLHTTSFKTSVVHMYIESFSSQSQEK